MFCTLLRKWQSFIYVFPRSDHWLRFAVIRFPYQIWVSRLRGLPVPSFRFPEKLVSVALLKESAIAFTTGLLQPSAYAAWIYRFIQHKHYIHHRMCEHGLSSSNICQRLPQQILYFLNTSFSKRVNRFKISTLSMTASLSTVFALLSNSAIRFFKDAI